MLGTGVRVLRTQEWVQQDSKVAIHKASKALTTIADVFQKYRIARHLSSPTKAVLRACH